MRMHSHIGPSFRHPEPTCYGEARLPEPVEG